MLCGRGQLERPNRRGMTRARVQYFIEPEEGVCEIKGAPDSFAGTTGWTLCDSQGANWTIERLDCELPAVGGWIRVSVKRASSEDAA